MYGIYANIGGILMVNVTIYSIHGSYGLWLGCCEFIRFFPTMEIQGSCLDSQGKADGKSGGPGCREMYASSTSVVTHFSQELPPN
jgi:hypothetical protein